MVTQHAKDKILETLKDLCYRSFLVLDDGTEKSFPITEKRIENNILKLYFQADKGVGKITSIIVKDKDENIVIDKARDIQRSADYGLVASIWIKLTEEEVKFTLGGGIDG